MALGYIPIDEIKQNIICFSINVTEICNCSCSYCHFYLENPNREYKFCIDDRILDNYIKLLNYFKNYLNQSIHIRLSGGEPLILGSKLFFITDKIYKETGIKPYVLTNGKLLNKDVIDMAIKFNVDKFIMSFENPFKIDKYSVNTFDNIESFNKLNSYSKMIFPGVVVVTNDMFKKLYDICDFFYNSIGEIPTISEASFKAYKTPDDFEIDALQENIKLTAKKFFSKTPLELFPYITPEISFNYNYKYVIDLYIGNRFEISDDNIPDSTEKIYKNLFKTYINNFCNNINCEWYNSCQHIRLFWKDKMDDYCKFKKAICNGFFDAIFQ